MTTTYEGELIITPPLNESEVAYLRAFAGSRRMANVHGPYWVADESSPAQLSGLPEGVTDYNTPPDGQPDLWCPWVPDEDGAAITAEDSEDAFFAPDWLAYIIEHFLKPGARAQGKPGFESFTFDHYVSSFTYGQDDETGLFWKVVVEDNVVTEYTGNVIYDEVGTVIQPKEEDQTHE